MNPGRRRVRATLCRSLLGCVAFWGCFVITACNKTGQTALPPLGLSEVSGSRLWQRIFEEEPFASYPSWPGYDGLQPGQSPHGRFHRIYINRSLAGALPARDNRAPDGAIIIKENYGPDRKVSGYTVMAKVSGYNPAVGDWFWAMYSPEGSSLAEGKLTMCIDCHSASASDFVLLQPLDRVPEQRP